MIKMTRSSSVVIAVSAVAGYIMMRLDPRVRHAGPHW